MKTTINVGTNYGNITNLVIEKEFDEITTSDLIPIAEAWFTKKDVQIHGWALIKEEKKSNMYEFIGETINLLLGKCQHSCKYCYVEGLKRRFEALNTRYSGEVRLDEKVLKKRLKKGIKYFVGSCNDIFADNVPYEMKKAIIDWCNNNPQSEILLQTKNPNGIEDFIRGTWNHNQFGEHITICITIETDDYELTNSISDAPPFRNRIEAAERIAFWNKVQVTIEPIMKIKNIKSFAQELSECNLIQINIGADSGHNNLPEPTKEEVLLLISELERLGQKVHLKNNLKRIIG